MMAGLIEEDREETWGEIEVERVRFENGRGFVGPCEMLVGAGVS